MGSLILGFASARHLISAALSVYRDCILCAGERTAGGLDQDLIRDYADTHILEDPVYWIMTYPDLRVPQKHV